MKAEEAADNYARNTGKHYYEGKLAFIEGFQQGQSLILTLLQELVEKWENIAKGLEQELTATHRSKFDTATSVLTVRHHEMRRRIADIQTIINKLKS